MLRECPLSAWTEKGMENGKMGGNIYDFGFLLQNDSLLRSCLLEPGQNGLQGVSTGGLSACGCVQLMIVWEDRTCPSPPMGVIIPKQLGLC